MRILIHDKNAQLTQANRDYCQQKMLKLSKYVKEPTTLEAHFEKIRSKITIHVTITHPGEKLPDHYNETADNIREVIDSARHRIEKHLRRRHSKNQ